MRFVIAPDSFKESLTAKEVAINIQAGLEKIFPSKNTTKNGTHYVLVPMADGGEGTVQSLVDAHKSNNSKIITTQVFNALFCKITARYGMWTDTKNGVQNKTAVIEMAEASGIQKISSKKRNIMKSSTYGTGQLILHALKNGVTNIILGIGGSATNDGGAGMAQALGVIFYDKNNNQISHLKLAGGNLNTIAKIDTSHIHPMVKKARIQVACDVTNPLCGTTGAAYVFAAQKGATTSQIKTLDLNLLHYAKIISRDVGKYKSKNIKDVAGSGAAGGLGAGLLAFTCADLKSGIQIVIEACNLTNIIQKGDIVITGEGRMDGQSLYGKTPIGVAEVAKKKKCIVIAICGSVKDDYHRVFDTSNAIDAVFTIIPGPANLKTILGDGKKNIQRTAENIARLIKKMI